MGNVIEVGVLEIGQVLYSKPIKDLKKINHVEWEVKAIYKDTGDGNGVGYLLISENMQWRVNRSSIGKTLFVSKEDFTNTSVFVA